MKLTSTCLSALVVLALAGSAFAQATAGDTDRDLDTDLTDFKKLVECATGPGGEVSPECTVANLDGSGGVDLLDFAVLQRAFSPWSRITEMSPANAEDMVALTRETIITIPNGVDAATVSNDNVFATFGGTKLTLLNDAPRVTPDGKRIKLFYDPPLPPAARVRVTVLGSSIIDLAGNAVDADNDGVPGGTRIFDFDTCSTACIPNTTVFGFIFESKLRGAQGEDLPLVGVTICVEGIPDLCAVTDATGRFELGVAPSQGCPLGGVPAPEFIVHLDGKTVTAVGGNPFDRTTSGGFYPTITKTFRSNAGHTVQIMQDNTAFDMYLPFVADEVLQAVNPTQMTEIGLTPEGVTRFCELFPDECAANPNAADALKLMIPPGSFNNDDGTPGNMAGIFPVDSARLPAPLPGAQVHIMDITVQSDGATNFDLPTPICFPNVPDADGNRLRPGDKTGLVSFNHDTGKWEFRGSMTGGPDDDGDGFSEAICPDAGVGVAAPGWHGVAPLPDGPPPPPPPCPPDSLSLCQDRCQEDSNRCVVYRTGFGLACIVACARTGPFRTRCLKACVGGVIGADTECTHILLVCNGRCREDCEGGATGMKFDKLESTENDLVTRATAGDPISDQIALLVQEMMTLLSPSVMAGQQIPPDIQEQVVVLLSEANTLGGGDALQFMNAYLLQKEEAAAPLEAEIGEAVGTAPPYPVLYLAEIYLPTSVLRLRGETSAFGQYTLFVPQNGTIVFVSFYDTRANEWGGVYPRVRPDAPFLLPRFYLRPVDDSFPDFDNDGLADTVELVYGTDTANPDTDGDGVSDGAEVRAGTNPLDGLPAATGILASADTPGNAIDVCAINNVAIVADSNSGVTVFNVTAGQAPVAVAQIDTPGSALAVSCTGNLIAVADGNSGLTIIDVTDPPAARVVREVAPFALGSGSAQAIASAADLVLVGTTGGFVSMVEINTGVVLDRINLGGAVQDLAIVGETLYAYANRKLQTLSFLRGPLTLLGSISSPGFPSGRGRIFVGGGVAYLVKSNGFNTFDVSDPANPVLIASGSSGQRGWQDIVTNGSGIGVAAVAPFGLNTDSNVSLYDTRDPTATTLDNTFLTTFPTPGIARAVTLFNGQAFVADGTSGLQKVNYKAFDTGTTPPTGSMTSNVVGSVVTEGRRIVLSAGVADDVQIRNVEFFVDGTPIVADGSFPYETAFRIPLGRVDSTITFTGTASDTGGNTLDLGPITMTVAGDMEPPTVMIDEPMPGDVIFVNDQLLIDVTALDNVEVVSVTFELDGISVAPRRITLMRWELDSPTVLGPHEVTVTATDTAGLSASASVTFLIKDRVISREFTVFNDLMNPVVIRSAASREFTVLNDLSPPADIRDAFSREFTVFNDLVNPVSIRDVVSREFTVSVGPGPP